MIRRMFCLLCAVLLFTAAVPVHAEESGGRYSYDFDLTFSLNAESFPAAMRSRASGYAALINRLGIKGNIAWSDITQSMELSAVLYYTDKPALSFPFRFYGTESWLFCTSPIMNNAVLFFNLVALMEYSVKVRNTLGLPLPYLAFLYPYTTKYAFSGIADAWQNTIGTFRKSGKVTVKQFEKLSDQWSREFKTNPNSQRWVAALVAGSKAPDAVEAEYAGLPDYYRYVTGGKALKVTVGSGSEVWTDSRGSVLFSRQAADDSLSLSLSLPGSANHYKPDFSFFRQDNGSSVSFSLTAAVYQEDKNLADLLSAGSVAAVSAEEEQNAYAEDDEEHGEYAEESEYVDYGETGDELYLPDLLFWLSVDGRDLPYEIPADSSFSLSATTLGAVYPNFTFQLRGNTKTDGSLTVSLLKPFSGDGEPVMILSCSGTVLPGELRDIPNYQAQTPDDSTSYNVFSFNEERLSDFTHNVLPYLLRNLFSFVAEAPTAACQSFLDDLTEAGVLDMLLH